MTDGTLEPRGTTPEAGEYTPLTDESPADVVDDSQPLTALPGDGGDDGSVAGAEDLPEDVPDGDIGAHEPQEN